MKINSTQMPGEGVALVSHAPPAAERVEKPDQQLQSEAPQAAATPTVDRGSVEHAASVLQEFVQSQRRNINFSVDDGNGQVVVKVTDPLSGNLIRQIPSEEALQIAENLDAVRSLLFKAEA